MYSYFTLSTIDVGALVYKYVQLNLCKTSFKEFSGEITVTKP